MWGKPKYVGVLSCSGEEIPGGTVSRVASLLVLSELLPGNTTTICVPLFLAGAQGEQDFVKNYPCITVDGCDKRCAARSVENLGGKAVSEFIVPEFFTSEEYGQITSGPLHDLKLKDNPLCQKLAIVIAEKIQKLNG